MLEKTSPIRTLRKNAVIKRSSVDFRLYQPAAKENQAPFSGLFLDRLKRLRVRTSQSNKELRTGRSINKEKISLGKEISGLAMGFFHPSYKFCAKQFILLR